MAGFQQNEDDIISTINITPLVDIMLVLLIIFMLVSTITDFNSIEVELPQAATGKDVNKQSVSVMISRMGDFFLSGAKMGSMDDIAAELKTRKEKDPDIQVIISADKKVCHEQVVRVIDMVRKLDIRNFAINVEYLEGE